MKKLVTLFILFALTGAVQAEGILIDFSDPNATTISDPDDAGNYWNSVVSNGSIADIIDMGNTASGISLTLSTQGDNAGNGVAVPAGTYATYAMGINNTTGQPSKSYVYANVGSTATITFGGMTQGETLELVVFGSSSFGAASGYAQYTLSGNGTDDVQVMDTWNNDSSVVTLSQTANASGEVVLSFVGNTTADFTGGNWYAQVNTI